MKKSNLTFIHKLLLCCLPLIWGLLVQAPQLFASLPLIGPLFAEGPWMVIRTMIMCLIVYRLFLPELKNSQQTKLILFGYQIPMPPLSFFIVMLVLGVAAFPFISDHWLKYRVVQGIIISVIIEELVARSFFLKYNHLTTVSFLGWMFTSSAAFSLMHWFYQADFYQTLSWSASIDKFFGHFYYGVLMALVVKKTGRIEVGMLLHMLGNIIGLIAVWLPLTARLLQYLDDLLPLLILIGKK